MPISRDKFWTMASTLWNTWYLTLPSGDWTGAEPSPEFILWCTASDYNFYRVSLILGLHPINTTTDNYEFWYKMYKDNALR